MVLSLVRCDITACTTFKNSQNIWNYVTFSVLVIYLQAITLQFHTVQFVILANLLANSMRHIQWMKVLLTLYFSRMTNFAKSCCHSQEDVLILISIINLLKYTWQLVIWPYLSRHSHNFKKSCYNVAKQHF